MLLTGKRYWLHRIVCASVTKGVSLCQRQGYGLRVPYQSCRIHGWGNGSREAFSFLPNSTCGAPPLPSSSSATLLTWEWCSLLTPTPEDFLSCYRRAPLGQLLSERVTVDYRVVAVRDAPSCSEDKPSMAFFHLRKVWLDGEFGPARKSLRRITNMARTYGIDTGTSRLTSYRINPWVLVVFRDVLHHARQTQFPLRCINMLTRNASGIVK